MDGVGTVSLNRDRVTREREHKLGIDALVRLNLGEALDSYVTQPRDPRQLITSYYDTADLRLLRWGCTLRYRVGEGWLVKLPVLDDGTMLTRDEVAVDGAEGGPPPQALTIVRPFARGRELVPLVRLDTIRKSTWVTDAQGEPLAEISEDAVTAYAGGAMAKQFREVEIEWQPGVSSEVGRDVVTRLQAAGATVPIRVPKLRRAIEADAAAAPEVVVAELGASATAADVIRSTIAEATRRLVLALPGVVVDEDPEAVHQARVATRRLRSNLRTFAPLLDEGWQRALRDELRWLAGLMQPIREADVMLETLESAARTLDPSRVPPEPIVARLLVERQEARETLVAMLESERTDQLLDRVIAASRSPHVNADAGDLTLRELRSLAGRPGRRLRRAASEIDPGTSADDLHRVRILTKRARYAAEAVQRNDGKAARRRVRRLTALQSLLGDHNDAVVAAEWLRAQPITDPGMAFEAGELTATLEAMARDHARSVRRALRRAGLR